MILILWLGSAVGVLIFIDHLRKKGKFQKLKIIITYLTLRLSIAAKKKFYVLFCFMASAMAFYAYYTYRPLSYQDLHTISGPMKDYSFRDYGRNTQVAFIELINYANTFKISNTSDDVFNRRNFERHDRRDKTLTLKIKHEDVRRLVHPGEKTTADLRIWIYELIAGDETFMSLKSYVDYESKEETLGSHLNY